MSGARYETGEGYTLFRIQRDGPNWERGLYREWVLGPDWKKYFIAERFNHTLPEGEIVAAFSGGYPAQHIEIAGLEVRNLGPDADLDALPTLEVEYVGSEPDAAWRRSALERIEQHRKGDLTIELRDANGDPVPYAEVHVEMTRHRFGFGVAISASWLDQNWDTPAGQKYRETVLEHFNAVALENALKWARWEREPEVALRTLRWAKDNGLQTHGHVLVWPGLEKFRVEDAAELWAAAQDNPQLLRNRVNDHIRSILEGTHGLVDVWDVVNEAYNQNEFIELLGESEVAEWFKLADTYAPEATLFYNDFGLVGQSGTNRVKQQFVADLIQGVRDRSGRVDAVGLQSHLGSGLTPPPPGVGHHRALREQQFGGQDHRIRSECRRPGAGGAVHPRLPDRGLQPPRGHGLPGLELLVGHSDLDARSVLLRRRLGMAAGGAGLPRSGAQRMVDPRNGHHRRPGPCLGPRLPGRLSPPNRGGRTDRTRRDN